MEPPFLPSVSGVKALSHPAPDALWVRVYYEDTDFSGRVYHASYLRFLERGRTEWLRRRGFAHRDLAQTSGVVFAVRALQIEYLAPAMMDDLLTVETSAVAVRGASIKFRQRVLREDAELVTAGALVASIRDGRPARIPADLRRHLQASS
jgi:acyl-CoA thioester hydrolase